MQPKPLYILALIIIFIPISAQARARDDVMANAFRCASVSDSRQWLNCYYGAAQPARAQLALPPAPAAQISLATSPTTGGEILDQKTRNDVMSGAFGCNDIIDERQWLDCYYAAAQPMRSELALPPVPQFQHPLPTVRAEIKQPSPSGPKPSEREERSADHSARLPNSAGDTGLSMASYTFDRDGIFIVTLANGQVWHQHPTDDQYAHWNKVAASYKVSIIRGWLGSYSLKVQGVDVDYKVDRIK